MQSCIPSFICRDRAVRQVHVEAIATNAKFESDHDNATWLSSLFEISLFSADSWNECQDPLSLKFFLPSILYCSVRFRLVSLHFLVIETFFHFSAI